LGWGYRAVRREREEKREEREGGEVKWGSARGKADLEERSFVPPNVE
jgi:hypothetical protein